MILVSNHISASDVSKLWWKIQFVTVEISACLLWSFRVLFDQNVLWWFCWVYLSFLLAISYIAELCLRTHPFVYILCILDGVLLAKMYVYWWYIDLYFIKLFLYRTSFLRALSWRIRLKAGRWSLFILTRFEFIYLDEILLRFLLLNRWFTIFIKLLAPLSIL